MAIIRSHLGARTVCSEQITPSDKRQSAQTAAANRVVRALLYII